MTSTVYTITVGAGGAGSGTNNVRGTDGGDSSISGSGLTTITSVGGGGGGSYTVAQGGTNSEGRDGGSGGGGAGWESGSTAPVEVEQPIKVTMEETDQILIVLEVAVVLLPLAHLGVPAQRILVVLVVMALLQQ